VLIALLQAVFGPAWAASGSRRRRTAISDRAAVADRRIWPPTLRSGPAIVRLAIVGGSRLPASTHSSGPPFAAVARVRSRWRDGCFGGRAPIPRLFANRRLSFVRNHRSPIVSARPNARSLGRQCPGRPLRQASHDRVCRFEHAPALGPPAGQGLHRTGDGLALQPIEHVRVLALDDGPGVVALEVSAAVLAERRGERGVAIDRAQRLEELLEPTVEEAGIAPQALPVQHVARRVGQDGFPERPGLERDHREAFEIGRHDQQLGGRYRVELVLVRDESQVVDARVLRNLYHRRADEHEV
jgi:hypothetical protein